MEIPKNTEINLDLKITIFVIGRNLPTGLKIGIF